MIKIVKTAIRSELIGNTTLMAELDDDPTRVTSGSAQADATLPYIIISGFFGGSDNTVADSLDLQFDVKAVAADGETADDVAALIFTVLDNVILDMTAPWGCISLQSISIISFEEHIERTQYNHAGHTFRLRAHKV